MDSGRINRAVDWVLKTIFVDHIYPEWFLLPFEVVDELVKDEKFDLCTHCILVGGTGSVGVIGGVPIKIGYKHIPCYCINYKVTYFKTDP